MQICYMFKKFALFLVNVDFVTLFVCFCYIRCFVFYSNTSVTLLNSSLFLTIYFCRVKKCMQ